MPFQDVRMSDRIEEQMNLDGRMELEDDGDNNGWYLTPVDDEVRQDQDKPVEPFEIGSTTKVSRLRRAQQTDDHILRSTFQQCF